MSALLEEKDRIRELTAEYSFRFDGADFEGWVELWTEDGTLEVDGKAVGGRTALREFALAQRLVNGKPPVKHVVTNQIIDVQGSAASARCYLLTLVKRKNGSLIVATGGVYRDQLVKSDDQWRFKKRTLSGDLRFETAA